MECGLAFVLMTASTRNGLMSRRGCGKAVNYHRYCSTYPFAAALHVVLVRFSQDDADVRDLAQLIVAVLVRTEKQDPSACVRRAVWDMFSADDAGIVSKSAEGLAKMMTVIATVFDASGLTVLETKKEENYPTNTRPDNPRTPFLHRSGRSEV